MRKIRDAEQEILQLRLDRFQAPLEVGELAVGAIRLGHQSGDVLALRLRLTDTFGELIARRLQLLRVGLDALALAFDRLKRGDIEDERARRKASCHGIDVAAEELRIEHAYFFFFTWPSRLRKYASLSATFASRPRSVGSYHFTSGMSSGK